jgi:phospholipid transport system substrate-binding protein
MKMVRFSVVLLSVVLISAPGAFAEVPSEQPVAGAVKSTSPLSDMRATIDKLVDVVAAYPGDANKTDRRSKLYDVIAPHFDFEEMAKRSLGTNWSTVTQEEQSEFVKIFSKLLARTYLEKIEGIKKDIVKFKGEEIEFPKALVKTTVENKGDIFPIEYKMMNKDGEWKVYDVVIENIGLVSNYRNEFAGIIRREKFTGLLEKLKAKNEQV